MILGQAMNHKQESYPAKIRRIALDLTQVRELYELEFAAEKLQRIADELEEKLQQPPIET
jgi:hypothetical protein